MLKTMIRRRREFFSKYKWYLKKAGRFKRKAREVRKKAVNQMAKLIAEFLKEKGVSTVYIGDSVCYCVCREDLVEEVVSKPTRELLKSFFAPRQIINVLKRHCEVKGIRVVEVDERGSSSYCPICGSKVERPYGGLVVCEKCGSFNADLAASFNILKSNSSVSLEEDVLKRLLDYPKTYIRHTYT